MYVHVKRIVDFTIALLMLIIFSPLMLATCALIKLNNDGPILFRQVRPGKGCKPFTIYKFRTMSVKATDKNGNALTDMDRMTKIGKILRKTSVDELPQLINIIRGEMSFIGPRPLLCEYLDLYTDEQKRRQDVLPGISGWAQVNGRNTITWEEKFNYDLYYVDNISLKLDLKILFKTIANVMTQKGINSGESNTMEKFSGEKIEELNL